MYEKHENQDIHAQFMTTHLFHDWVADEFVRHIRGQHCNTAVAVAGRFPCYWFCFFAFVVSCLGYLVLLQGFLFSHADFELR